MARGKRMTVGSKYVGIGALTELLVKKFEAHPDLGAPVELAEDVAAYLVGAAWDVEHFPVAGKVTITLDLGRLDQPADQPGPDAATSTP